MALLPVHSDNMLFAVNLNGSRHVSPLRLVNVLLTLVEQGSLITYLCLFTGGKLNLMIIISNSNYIQKKLSMHDTLPVPGHVAVTMFCLHCM